MADAGQPPGGSSGLLQLIVAVMALAPALALLSDTTEIPLGTRAAAYLSWVLCVLPAWGYLRTPRDRRAPIPFLPIIGIVFGLYFALQIALGEDNRFYRILMGATPRLDPTTAYDEPTYLFLTGWVILLLAHAIVRRAAAGSARRTVDVPLPPLRRIAFGLAAMGAAFDIAGTLAVIPTIVGGLATFISSLGLFGLGLLVVLFARGNLRRGERIGLVALVVFDGTVRLMSGSIGNLAFLIVVLVAGTWIAVGRLRRRTLSAALICILAWTATKGFQAQFRRQVWYRSHVVALNDRVRIFSDIAQGAMRDRGFFGVVGDGAEALIARSASIDMFADVIRLTPDAIPYWHGESYIGMAGTFVPRFLWPDKPKMQLGQAFGHRYHYLGVRDRHTSMNLPYLIEFYANFGGLAVALGMLLVGAIFGLLEAVVNRPGQPMLRSVAGLVLFLPLLNVESDFSLNFGGLFLNSIALATVLYFLNRMAQTTAAPLAESVPLTAASIA
jgi:hypothetical protein